MAVELYPHNQKTYENMVSMFKDRNRVGIVQPTGTGKSFLYLKWIEDHPQDTFAVLSPSTEIFNQLREYADASGELELLDSVQMISYQTLQRMSPEEIRSIHADKMVLDEFHRTGAELWGPAVQHLLDANPQTQVLGASATPVRYLDERKDMASELFDRNLAVEMTLGEAVQRNILPTPQYIPVWYDIDGKMDRYKEDIASIANAQERRELEEKLEQMRRKLQNSYGAEDIFKKYLPHNHGKYIVFCRDQAHLTEMQKTVRSWLAGVNSNVHSYVSISAQSDKDLQLEAFKTDKSEDAVKLLFTIDRLNEGVHVKGIDGVIMLRPTVSPIIYLQQMGRALAVGNKNPQIFDMVNNYQSVQTPLSTGEAVNVFEKEFSDAMEKSNDIRSFKVFEDMKEFAVVFEQLEDRLYPSHDSRWEQNFQVLQRFCEENHRLPQQKETYEGVALGQWVHNQRITFQTGNYPPERQQKLESLGVVFGNLLDVQWEQTYSVLQRFCEEHHRLPKQSEIYDSFAIGRWVAFQKTRFKAGNYPFERQQKLESLGVVFENLIDIQWEEKYQVLQRFCEEHHRLPQQRETHEGVAIGVWVNSQKTRFKSGNYPPELQQKMERLGVVFENLIDIQWEENYRLLQKYCDEFCRPPKYNVTYEGVAIGIWIANQKTRFKAGNYPTERVQKLQALGISLEPKAAVSVPAVTEPQHRSLDAIMSDASARATHPGRGGPGGKDGRDGR